MKKYDLLFLFGKFHLPVMVGRLIAQLADRRRFPV